MLVIADSSPLIVLSNIGQIEVLPKLFGRVVIPPAVLQELTAPSRSDSLRALAASLPEWLDVQRPINLVHIPKLHRGESEALSLAIELDADLILIDDRRAYREAVARHLNAIGTIRALELAAEQSLLDLKDTFERVKRTDFWISHNLLDARLKRFEEQQRRRPS
jgi:predicted nucleic acid-binding protein